LKTSIQLIFGGFLIGLGLGWFISQTFTVTYTLFGWLIIMVGAGVVVSALISWKMPRIPIGGLLVALLIGIILPLATSSGFNFSGEYKAEEIRTFEGALIENIVTFIVRNRNGDIYVSTQESSEYKVELTIRAKGLTVGDAETTIKGLDITLVEERIETQLRLMLEYNIPELTWRKLAIQVKVYLPEDANINLDLESSNGGIFLADIEGGIIQLKTSNGVLDLDRVYAESISGLSSNGRIIGEIEASNTILSTSNGRIDIILPCTRSGNYDLSTSNGAGILTLSSSSQIGYDLDLSTSNGDIDIDLLDLSYTIDEETNKKVKTINFNDREILITINLSTSNGDIHIGI
jgi:hypothetical protein